MSSDPAVASVDLATRTIAGRIPGTVLLTLSHGVAGPAEVSVTITRVYPRFVRLLTAERLHVAAVGTTVAVNFLAEYALAPAAGVAVLATLFSDGHVAHRSSWTPGLTLVSDNANVVTTNVAAQSLAVHATGDAT